SPKRAIVQGVLGLSLNGIGGRLTLGGAVDDDKKVRVLIADDSAPVRQRLATLLEDTGMVDLVGEASDALETLVDIKELKPDVVILDIQMPAGSGISVLRWAQRELFKPK